MNGASKLNCGCIRTTRYNRKSYTPAVGTNQRTLVPRDQVQLSGNTTGLSNPYGKAGFGTQRVTITPNDNLESILKSQGFSAKEIYSKDGTGQSVLDRVAQANDLRNPNLISSGSSLLIPQLSEKSKLPGTNAKAKTKTKTKPQNHQQETKPENKKPALFNGTPDYKAISQGKHGDCQFLAATINLAKNDPEKLKRMIRANKDGTYSVTLRAGKTLKVEPLTDAERKKAASAGSNGEWLPILEKAYLKDSTGLRGLSHIGDLFNPQADVDNLLFTSKKELRDDLGRALREKKTITVGKNKQLFGEKQLADNHAYAVVGFDGKDKVKVMNPWGRASGARGELRDADGNARDGVGDGIMTMSLDEFKSQFTTVTYKTPRLGRGV